MSRLLTRRRGHPTSSIELPDWRRADADEPSITATYELADFAAALAFVNAVGDEAEQMNHHPDIDIRWNKVTLVLSTHSEGGLTQARYRAGAPDRATQSEVTPKAVRSVVRANSSGNRGISVDLVRCARKRILGQVG